MKTHIENTSKLLFKGRIRKFLVPGLVLSLFIIGFYGCNKDEVADFTANFTVEFVDDNNVRFTNASSGEYHSLIWSFGNGLVDTTTNINEVYVTYFPEAGSFNASLTLINFYGDKKTANQTIEISVTDLVISFTAEIDQEEPNYVLLTNTSQGSYDSFKWMYRSFEIENEMEHLAYFPLAGDYEIQLVLTINGVDYSSAKTTTIDQDDPNLGGNLVWSEEFEYTGLPDPSIWNMEIGGDGWGNEELQYYTDSEDNAYVDNGILTITAREEQVGSNNYTSARITTQGKFDFKYGRIEARIRNPFGQGMWPAFWMLGANFSSVGWPQCGEIDIMEMVGGTAGGDNVTYSTIHWDNNGTPANFGQSYTLPSGNLADNFHVYAVEWNEQEITAFIDDTEYFVVDITPADMSEFQNNFFIILNLAVGGDWPGPPNADTQFPQTMEVDYVRVYQNEE